LRSTILDGEVVAVDENGIPRFQLLQRFQKQPAAPTLYYVFDVGGVPTKVRKSPRDLA
jgi:ATP-dependent DNA ligase